MPSLHDVLRASAERMRKAYFLPDEAGHLLYFPYGLKNFYSLSKRTYRVPSDDVADRIIGAHRRYSLGFTALTVAVFGAVLLAMAFRADWVFDLGRAVPWLPLPLMLAVALLPVFAPGWLVARRMGPLERGRDRTFADYLRIQEKQFGIRTAWFLSACVALYAAFMFWMAWGLAAKGLVSIAMVAGAIAASMLPLLVLGPALSRMRRMRAENERLETVIAERTRELRELNLTLEQRVQDQVQHIEKLGQLKHFFAAPVAEMILNDKGFDPSRVHRRELTAVSIDLRGFTSFSETSEPEEVISVLRIYHAELGIQVNRCGATLEHFAGDGVMLFLNDPVEVPDHPMRALELATALRTAMRPHLDEWKSNGFDIGLGIGIATGYATIGAVGYEGRWEYAAIGTVCNLAARLCAEAKDGQIIVSKRYMSRLEGRATFEAVGERPLKGLSRPVAMFNVARLGVEAPVGAEAAG